MAFIKKTIRVLYLLLLHIFSVVGILTVVMLMGILMTINNTVNTLGEGNQRQGLLSLSMQKTEEVTKPKILFVSLSGQFAEDAEGLHIDLSGKGTKLIHTYIHRIYEAAEDENIKGMLLAYSNGQLGVAQSEELRAAVAHFKSKNKPIRFYAQDFGYKNALPYYTIALEADKIYMQPSSTLILHELDVQQNFFADLLKEQGLAADFMAMGAYKSFADRFTRSSFNEKVRQNMTLLVDDISQNNFSLVAKRLGKSSADTLKHFQQLPLYSSERALRNKLITDVAYFDDVKKAYVEELQLGKTEEDGDKKEADKNNDIDDNFVNVEAYMSPKMKFLKSDDIKAKDKIGVIVLEGEIIDNGGGASLEGEVITPAQVETKLKHASKIENLKALVVRINSPGGSATASETIWHSIKAFKEEHNIPVITSMGGIAASGGYYIACAGDKIMADANTITGSIGVIFGKFVIKDFLKKWGVNMDYLKDESSVSHALGFSRKFNERERKYLVQHLEEAYTTFKTRVSEARNLDMNAVENVAQGQVWSGKRAIEKGLVDEQGGLREAIAKAAELAATEDFIPQMIQEPRNIFLMLKQITQRASVLFNAANVVNKTTQAVENSTKARAQFKLEAHEMQ